MRFHGFFLALGVLLTVFGWRMAAENWRSLRRGEGMYNPSSRSEALWSGSLLIVLGTLILLAGLAIVVGYTVWMVRMLQ